jgi:hypothetical protein
MRTVAGALGSQPSLTVQRNLSQPTWVPLAA